MNDFYDKAEEFVIVMDILMELTDEQKKRILEELEFHFLQ
jgi:hypothetical protein